MRTSSDGAEAPLRWPHHRSSFQPLAKHILPVLTWCAGKASGEGDGEKARSRERATALHMCRPSLWELPSANARALMGDGSEGAESAFFLLFLLFVIVYQP